ncbi:MAG: Holliday junction resolvase RuvX [Clostridia bacterium]|nr:Holliday junction resolvase RuvX [Clostridia bacterium]
MKIMSVDLGLVRTGVAVSDINESFAFPDSVITERNAERLAEKIANKASELSAELIVVGLPRNMDGSEGFRAEECRQAAKRIEELSGLNTVLWDERCTTLSAHTVLNMNDTKGKKRKETVDAVAAVMILEDYLAFRKNQR